MIELIVSLAVSGTIALVIVNFVRVPTKMAQMNLDGERSIAIMRAMDRLADELKEADPQSVNWGVLPSSWTFSFQKTNFDMATAAPTAATPVQFFLRHQMTPVKEATLWRSIDGIARPMAYHIAITTNPFVKSDPVAFHVLSFEVAYQPTGRPLIRLIRRTAIKG